MDTNFQTSFIPKKPLAEDRVPAPTHTSLLSFIATLIFFASLAAAAGMYFYKASLVKNIATMNSELAVARNSFELPLIAQMQILDRRITDANSLLASHIVVSPIFAALESDTLKSIQFTKFTYTTPSDPTAPITVKMSGRALSYSAIALESDQLATNPDIHNSIFSNLALDQQTGMVTFDLVFTVDPDLVRFTSHLGDLVSQAGTAPLASSSSSASVPAAGAQTPAVSSGTAVPQTPAAGQSVPAQGAGTAVQPSGQ